MGEVEAFGMGGTKLDQQGLERVVDTRGLLAMGFFELVSRLPTIRAALAELARVSAERKPDLAVVIDYPDFHFRLAKELRAQGIPIVYYIPPKVWVWRKSRVRALQQLFAKVLCVFPFEVEFHRRQGGNVTFVGNPLLDELPIGMSREEARGKLGIASDAKVLVLMPGSRPSELKHHTELMLEGAVRAAAELRSTGKLGANESLITLMPLTPSTSEADVRARVSAWLERMGGGKMAVSRNFILDPRISVGDSSICLAAADVGMIKSGTSTLEAALMGCPHAVVFKTNWFTAFVFRYLIRYLGPVSLPNLILSGNRRDSERIANEILLHEATPVTLGKETSRLFHDTGARIRLAERLKKVYERLRVGDASPSRLAAQEVLDVLQAGQTRKSPSV